MRSLLDTHTLVWWLTNDRKLSRRAFSIIAQAEDNSIVSAVTAFEIATKVRLGKFDEARAINENFSALITAENFTLLSITADHALMAGRFTSAHGDPFDRLLAAQAEIENLTLVTRDPAFASFGVETLW